MMIYSEAWARENMFTKTECTHEYQRHDLTKDDLVADLGDHTEYSGADVLNALGY